MTAALNIFRKDVRRFGLALLLAPLLHIFGYCVVSSNFDASRVFAGLGSGFSKVMHQAPMLQWVVILILSAWVILDDAGVGDRIAWMTRPVRGRDLLQAKAMFLLLAVALPSAAVSFGAALGRVGRSL